MILQYFGFELSGVIYAMMTACMLPFVWTIIAKIKGGFHLKDNKNPRAFLAATTGIAARANAAQQNSFETLPMFLAATVLGIYCFAPIASLSALSWMYVMLRIGYGICYLINASALRSALWFLSMVCIFLMFRLSLILIA